MSDDNVRALVKSAYDFETVPPQVWGKIKGRLDGENAAASKDSIDFILPGKDSESRHENRPESSNVVSFKRESTKRKNKIFISVATAAACVALCIVAIIGSGILKTPDEQQPGQMEVPMTLSSDEKLEYVENVRVLVGERVGTYYTEETSETQAPAGEFLSEQAQNELENAVITDSDFAYTEFGRWVTITFNGETPQQIDVAMSFYDADGNQQGGDVGIEEINHDTVESSLSFRIKQNIAVLLSSDLSYYSNDFYQVYKVTCHWENGVSGNYYIYVKVGEESATFTATVVEASPRFIIRAQDSSWLSSYEDIQLTNVAFAWMDGVAVTDLEPSAQLVEVGSTVEVSYSGFDFNGGFPVVIDGASVKIPVQIQQGEYDLYELITGEQTITSVTFVNDSFYYSNYRLTQSSAVAKLLATLEGVKVQLNPVESIDSSNTSGYMEFRYGQTGMQSSLWFGYEGDVLTTYFSAPDGSTAEIIVSENEAGLNEFVSTDFWHSLIAESECAEKTDADVNVEGTINLEDGIRFDLLFRQSYSIDLNSDGIIDDIYVDIYRSDEYYNVAVLITINGKTFSVAYGDLVNRGNNEGWELPDSVWFHIVDLDASDAYKEIIIRDFGASDDYVMKFFRYEDEALHYLGEVPSLPDINNNTEQASVYVDGTGVIYTTRRIQLLQTWFARTYYVYDTFEGFVEQRPELYEPETIQSGDRIPTALVDIALFTDRNTASETFIIPAGTKVTFPSTDNEHWVSVRTEDGTEGWLYLEDSIAKYVYGAPYTWEIFEGLMFAD